MKQKFILRYIKCSALLAGLCLFIYGCENSHHYDQAKLNTLIYCSEGSPDSFNPLTATSGTTVDASARQLFNRLVTFEPGTLNIIPSLAESWTIEGKTKYRFKLRKNVRFHSTDYFKPNRPLNADDILFSYYRQQDQKHPYHFIGGGKYPYFQSQKMGQQITTLHKVDDYTIEFILKKPSAPFLSILATEFMSIQSAEYADYLAQKDQKHLFDRFPIGTGPFKFKRYQPNAYIRYEAHEHYWQGKESIEQLIFAITPDPYLRFARLTAKECDVMSSPLPIQVQAAQKQKYVVPIDTPSLNVAYWGFNTRVPPLNSQKIRQALNHAIDKNKIIDAVYFGTAETAVNPLPPNMWSYHQAIEDYAYNPELSKQLLMDAGYQNGFELDIWTFKEQRIYNPNAKKTAELIQQDLKKVNVKVNIITYPLETLLERMNEGEHQAFLLGWSADNGDPDNFLGTLLSCHSDQNYAFWCDQHFDAIIADARSISDRQSRTELYKEAQVIFKEQAPWTPLAHSKQYLLVNKRVNNLKLAPTGGIYFSGVTLSNKAF